MIPPTQREAWSVLAEVVDLSPNRLGQLFAHLGFLGEDQTGRSLGNIDDEQLLAVLYHHRGELAARQTDLRRTRPTANRGHNFRSGDSKIAEAARLQ